MRYYLTTVRDLRNWVDAATTNWIKRTDADLDSITEAIRSGDHPAWGDDWTEFLESLPELTEFLESLPELTVIIQAPDHLTTIDQHRGDHSTGMRMMELKEIRTRFSDHSQESWESLTVDQRQWWSDVLEALHAAQVELAECDCDLRTRANELIDVDAASDLENCASVIRSAIEEAKAEVA